MRKTIFALTVALSASLIFSGCRKNDREEDTETNSSRDNALAQMAYGGILKMIGQYVDSSAYLRAAYPTFTVDSVGTASWPKTLTIDFGPGDCIGIDGATRRGKIIAVFSDMYRDSLSTINISLAGYYFNGRLVTVGPCTVTNNGHNSSGNLNFSMSLSNLKVVTTEGTITWNATLTREWTAGESTNTDPMDDVYTISGYGSGTGVNGNGFSMTINPANPLKISANCQYITNGTFAMTPNNLATRYVDFGTGACDNKLTVTINSKLYEIVF